MKIKEHISFIISFTFIVCLIFWDILTLKATFIKGDYLQQFFPWFYLYADSIKGFYLPLWTRYIQSGFPLFAEGQIGALYPLNILFFVFLPFKLAYNYSLLFHFILSGIFTYFFARKLKADFLGGMLSAILICFGSAYAGCFINTSALKSLTWFPLVLFIFEKYSESKNKAFLLLIGMIAGMQLLSGSIQMTFYAILFYFIYFLYKHLLEKGKALLFIRDIAIMLSIAFLISLPQMISTFQLAQYSNRSVRTLGFALWNSFSPAALIGSVFPYTGILFSRGNIMYIGVMGLFFAVVSIWLAKQKKEIRPLILLFAASLFLALGKYNPVYVALLKIFGFYSFRAPSRFIYFGVFALAVLSGVGFSYLFNNKDKIPAAIHYIFIYALTSAIGIFLLIKLLFKYFGLQILEIAKVYVARNIYGKPFHRYSLQTYMAKTEGFYNSIIEKISLKDPYVVLAILVVIFAILLLYITKKAVRATRGLKYACMVFICTELFIFSFFSKGIKPNIANFEYAQPKEERILGILQKDKTLFRICPFGEQGDIPLWIKPSMNAVYDLDSVAAYSPLVNRDYFQAMEGLGVVDDSLGIVPPEKETLYKKLNLLKNLNVKYIVSTTELKFPSLDYIMKENDIYLYSLKDYLPRFLFSKILAPEKRYIANIKVEKYRSGFVKIDLENKTEGFLIFLEKFYPGWQAYIDGKRAEIYRASNIFQAIALGPGNHTVIFKYQPAYFNMFLLVSAATFLFCLIYVIYRMRRKAY